MDQIEEVRAKIDIIALINEYVPLKKAGRNWRALCPFHSEKTPSFMVSSELGIYKCFGCSKGGNIFTFLMEYEKMTFGEALRFLAKKAGVKLTSYRSAPEEAEREKLYEINHLASEFYHYLLLNHRVGKSALAYILGRGISKQSLLDFKLGYAPALWDGIQKFLVGKKGYEPDLLERVGLVIESSKFNPPTGRQGSKYYDRFRDRLIFPLFDHRGNICGFAGRTISPEPEGAPKYINTPETSVYHKSELLYGLNFTKEEIKKADSVIVVEGELDVVSSCQAGVKNVVGIKGSALTESQGYLLKRYTENIILALDSDVAGDEAARRGINIAETLGFNIRVAILGDYKDPDEAAQKAPGFYRKQIQKAIAVYDFLIDSAFGRLKGDTAESKRKIGQELVPILAKVSDEIVKAHYVKLLAKKLRVEEEAVWNQILRDHQHQSTEVQKKPHILELASSRREVLEEYLLATLLQSGGKVLKDSLGKIKGLLKEPANKRLVELLSDYLRAERKFVLKKFGRNLPEELGEVLARFSFLDLEELLEDSSQRDREIAKALAELENLNLRERMKEISDEIGELEKEGKEKEIEKLEKELKKLSERLK